MSRIPAVWPKKPRRVGASSTKRSAFFYGWRIVVLGYILNLMTAGVGSSGFSVFVKPMGDDLGWNRSSVVAATALSMIAAAVFGHLIGAQLDKRHGARLVTTSGIFVIGLAMIATGYVNEIWQFLLIFFVAGAFGLHAYPMLIVPTIVSKWFVRKRGMAISFASMGLPSTGLLIVPYVNFLISSFDWRTAWKVLGFTTWGLALPWCFLFMKGRPEDMGLQPDGASQPAVESPENDFPQQGPKHALILPRGKDEADEYPWTIREATRTRAFWLVLLASSLGMMSFLAVLINFFAFVTDEAKGFTSGEATIALAIFSVFSLIGKLPWAFLADRIDIRYSTAFTYAVPGLALALLLNANAFWMLVLWGVIYGTGVSGISPLPALAWGNYYGRTFLGAIRGIASPITFLSQAAAPLFAAFMYDVTGGYETPFAIFLGIFLFSSFLMLLARRPPIPQAGHDLSS
ncbi:MAG: MFS transporter [Dehalococcoidia bacterium]